jgi:hypothetical protein
VEFFKMIECAEWKTILYMVVSIALFECVFGGKTEDWRLLEAVDNTRLFGGGGHPYEPGH